MFFLALEIRQAKRSFYILKCKLQILPQIFSFDHSSLSPELRSQRILNKSRIPELKKYILENRESYIFSALTASVSDVPNFISISERNLVIWVQWSSKVKEIIEKFGDMGTIEIPMHVKKIKMMVNTERLLLRKH